MIRVVILINDTVIHDIRAVNQGMDKKRVKYADNGVHYYELGHDPGSYIKHKREDGAEKLAVKMILHKSKRRNN